MFLNKILLQLSQRADLISLSNSISICAPWEIAKKRLQCCLWVDMFFSPSGSRHERGRGGGRGKRGGGGFKYQQNMIFLFFFFPAGSFQKADVMWGMLKCWFVVNSPGKHSRGRNCRKAVCVRINIPDGGPELTQCWCQEQHRLPRHPSPQNNCKSADCTNYPPLYRYPVKCSQSCHLTSFVSVKRCSLHQINSLTL